ncbi:Glycosyl transferase, family 14 [Dillenia turbinata]|uniref:Glycosyl transferase, family 14 n=1 Tax=Dillenia turbinata TaxID=194707 RepID=A0AAN8ZC89_9MAGN
MQSPLQQSLSTSIAKDPKPLYFLIPISILSLLFFLSLSSQSSSSKLSPPIDPFLFPNRLQTSQIPTFTDPNNPNPDTETSLPRPPSIAYLISGKSGDLNRIFRLLYALYHPNNQYLLHLDLTASQSDRERLALEIQNVPIFRAANNVNVVGKADFYYRKGSSPILLTLHGAAILLRISENWDWFVNLNAGDYPLVTQDDFLHILSYLPKDLNFVNHTSYIGWKESRKLRPIIVDPGLYLKDKGEVFYATQKRDLPNAYQLFTGSATAILSRKFVEFCILGTDNLPRTLLMYLTNTPSSLTNYFPTILCNSNKFNRTTVNYNLQYSSPDKEPKLEPRMLNSNDFDDMIHSGAAFATEFPSDDPILDRIDREILGRIPGQVVPGGWCLGEPANATCATWGDASVLKPGPGAKRLERRLVALLSNDAFRYSQCIVESS